MLTNCPLGNKETHACWECLYGIERMSDNRDVSGYDCIHPDYGKTKAKIRKIKRGSMRGDYWIVKKDTTRKVKTAFCINCGKYVEYDVFEQGVAQNTPRGIVFYKELYAGCKKCGEEIYLPEINDKNADARLKAFEVLPKNPEPEITLNSTEEIVKWVEGIMGKRKITKV